jgi:hypothetical protein
LVGFPPARNIFPGGDPRTPDVEPGLSTNDLVGSAVPILFVGLLVASRLGCPVKRSCRRKKATSAPRAVGLGCS